MGAGEERQTDRAELPTQPSRKLNHVNWEGLLPCEFVRVSSVGADPKKSGSTVGRLP
jgi:hypothetical protein